MMALKNLKNPQIIDVLEWFLMGIQHKCDCSAIPPIIVCFGIHTIPTCYEFFD